MSFGSTLSGCCTRSESALASQVLHHSVTTWLINFDGRTATSAVLNRNLRRGNDCTGSTVRRGGYLVAVLIHKNRLG